MKKIKYLNEYWKYDKSALFEALINNQVNSRGWSRINSANTVLHEFVDYVNKKYSDNGNTVSLRADSYLERLEQKKRRKEQ